MTDEEALKEIDRQEKRFAAAKCGRGLQHWQKTLKDVKRVFAALGGIDWNGEAIRETDPFYLQCEMKPQ